MEEEVDFGGFGREWSPDKPEMAYKLALFGLTDTEIAEALLISMTQFERWRAIHSEFDYFLRKGRVHAMANVAHSLYRSATGFEHEEEVASKHKDGTVEVVKVKKYYPPNPWAAVKLLALRSPEKWAENPKTVENKQLNIYNITNNNLDCSDFSVDEMRLLKKIGIKGLPSQAIGEND